MFRVSLLLLFLASVLLFNPGTLDAQEGPAFRLGFKLLADQIPDVVGAPRENEHYAGNGDSLQLTTTGLMVWRKADNWTAFTDGSRTWVNGPDGVQQRGNDERFPWEAPATAPATVAAPTLKPVTAPASIPTAAPAPTSIPVNFDLGAEQAALDMINRSRQQNGVAAVAMDDKLRQVARGHAQDMALRNYFAHNTPEGLTPFDRMKAAGILFGWAAENIGYALNYPNPTAAVQANHDAMMAETPPNDGHRQNILNGNLHKVGIGVYQTSDRKTYYVTDFTD